MFRDLRLLGLKDPRESGIIHLWDLPSDLTHVDLNKNFKFWLLYSAKNITGTWVELGKKLDLEISKNRKCKQIDCILSGKRFKLSFLIKLVDFLNRNGFCITQEDVENKTILLCVRGNGGKRNTNAILNPKFPFDFNTVEGATIIASLLGDGGISSVSLPHYNNNEVVLKKKVYEAYSGVFGGFVGASKNYYVRQQIYFPKIVGLILTHCFGLVKGRKTETNQRIPIFIMNSNDKIKGAFLQQFYDDEGCMRFKREDSFRVIKLKLANVLKADKNQHSNIKLNNILEYAPSLIKDIKKLLSDLGIESNSLRCVEIYRTKNGTYNTKWNFDISKKPNLKTFLDKVGFYLNRKQNKLIKSIDTYHDYNKTKQKRLIDVFKLCIELQNKDGCVMSRTLANRAKMSQEWSKKIIQQLREENKLILGAERKSFRGAKYFVSEN